QPEPEPEPEPEPPAEQTPPAEPPTQQQIEDALKNAVTSDDFNTIKIALGTLTNLTGAASEYISLADSPETIAAIKKAMQAWHAAPNPTTGKAYVNAIRQSSDLKLGRIANALGRVSQAVDIFEAFGKGLDKAAAEGFTSASDKALIIFGEASKKFLTWQLTKNPLVAIADWGVGTVTESLWGPSGRVDIGGGVDKAVQAVEGHVKDAAIEAGNVYGGGIEADANLQAADNFSNLIRRVRSQVDSGQITRAEGSRRLTRLREIMNQGV
ncbi:MAG: hypothetical protein WBJ62_00335, partial [Coriobacteriia bacterium]